MVSLGLLFMSVPIYPYPRAVAIPGQGHREFYLGRERRAIAALGSPPVPA
jgi:hypothetical protein